MTKKIKIDFYQVQMPDSFDESFADIISQISKLPDDEKRSAQISGMPVRLAGAALHEGFWEGDLTGIRMDDGVLVANRGGKKQAVALQDDEGLAGETAFAFHVKSGVLLLQRKHGFATGPKFATYFERMGGIHEPIELLPIYTRDALKRLNAMTNTHRIEIKIARPNVKSVVEGSSSVDDVVDLFDAFGAVSLSISASMGRTKNHSLKSSVKAMAKALTKVKGATATSVIVSGRTDEDVRDILDLVEERFIIEEAVDVAEYRTVSYPVRREALRNAWKKVGHDVLGLLEN